MGAFVILLKVADISPVQDELVIIWIFLKSVGAESIGLIELG